MPEPEPPPEPAHEPAAHVEPAREAPDPTWAAGVPKPGSEGPAGWPGAVLSSAHERQGGLPDELPVPSESPAIELAPASALPQAELFPAASAPATPPLEPPAITPPPPARPVQEVEALPLAASEKRGPTIDALPVHARAAEPESSFASAPIPPAPAADSAQTSSMPPPPSGGAPIPPREAPPVAEVQPAPKSGKVWTVLCHLMYLVPSFLPGLVVTTLLWVWHRKRYPLIEDQGREAINMQLTYFLASLVLGITCIGAPFILFLWVIGAIFCVIAAVRSADGEKYRYPYILRIIA